jgi:hypothetical protein
VITINFSTMTFWQWAMLFSALAVVHAAYAFGRDLGAAMFARLALLRAARSVERAYGRAVGVDVHPRKAAAALDALYKEIPPMVLDNSSAILDAHLNSDSKRILLERCRAGGEYWFAGMHDNMGVVLRGLLRDNGVVDELFPSKNLDHYYVLLLEHWIGARP